MDQAFKLAAVVGMVGLLVMGGLEAAGEQPEQELYLCGPRGAVETRLEAQGLRPIVRYRDEEVIKELWGNEQTQQWVLVGGGGLTLCTLRVGRDWALAKGAEGAVK